MKINWTDIRYNISNVWDNIYRFHYKIINFFINCWDYRSILWNDRDWDQSYFLTLMETKLTKMEKLFSSDKCHSVHAKRQAEDMRVCIELIKRLKADEYADYYYCNAPNDFMTMDEEPNERGLYVCHFKEYDKLSYFGKVSDKFVWDREKYMRKQDYEYLFKMLTKHLDTWWD